MNKHIYILSKMLYIILSFIDEKCGKAIIHII